MATETPIVLISRPLALSNEFKHLLGENVRCILSPIFEIEMLDVDIDLKSYTDLVLTSQNAVRVANMLMNLEGLTGYAVGARTASLARTFGMHVTHSDRGSDDLVEHIKNAKPTGRLLHIRGSHSIGDISDRLNDLGIKTDQVIAYLQSSQELSVQAKTALTGENPVLVPLFSPRTSALLGLEFAKSRVSARFELIGISKAAVDAWNGPEPDSVFVSSTPDMAAVVNETLQRIEQRS